MDGFEDGLRPHLADGGARWLISPDARRRSCPRERPSRGHVACSAKRLMLVPNMGTSDVRRAGRVGSPKTVDDGARPGWSSTAVP